MWEGGQRLLRSRGERTGEAERGWKLEDVKRGVTGEAGSPRMVSGD